MQLARGVVVRVRLVEEWWSSMPMAVEVVAVVVVVMVVVVVVVG